MSRGTTGWQNTLFIVAFMLSAVSAGYARNRTAPATPQYVSQENACPMGDLNFAGGDATMPPFSDSVVNPNSEFRRALCNKGMALRFVVLGQYVQNMLMGPVSAGEQAYVGERPFGWALVNPISCLSLGGP